MAPRLLALLAVTMLGACGFGIARHRPGSLPKARTITHSEQVSVHGGQEVRTYTPLANPTVERTGGGASGGSIGVELGSWSAADRGSRVDMRAVDAYVRYMRSKGRTGWSLRSGFGGRIVGDEGMGGLWIPLVVSFHRGDRDGARRPARRPPWLGWDAHVGAGPVLGRLTFGEESSTWLPGGTVRGGLDVALSFAAVEFVVGAAYVYVVTAETDLAGVAVRYNDHGLLWHMVFAL